jgi:hypothetical protein
LALVALAQLQANLAGARVRLLRWFAAVKGHDADGYGSATPWLMARAGTAGFYVSSIMTSVSIAGAGGLRASPTAPGPQSAPTQGGR